MTTTDSDLPDAGRAAVRAVLVAAGARIVDVGPLLVATWRGLTIRARESRVDSDEAGRIAALLSRLADVPDPVAVAEIDLRRNAGDGAAKQVVPMVTRSQAESIRDLCGDSFLVYFDRDTSAMTILGEDVAGRALAVEHQLPAVSVDGHVGLARRSAAESVPECVVTDEGMRSAKRRRIRELLRCCRCGARSPLRDQFGRPDRRDELECTTCGASYPVVDGIPILLRDPNAAYEPDSDQVSSNTYSQQALTFFSHFRDGLVLDCGSGRPVENLANVVHLEIVRHTNVDVVASSDALPFADESFDGIVCEAVLEHVPEPWMTADEFHRTLRRDGKILVDTPFLAPFHGYPNHFYNYTQSGLDRLLRRFEKIDGGIHPHQEPWLAIGWMLRLLREGLPAGELREQLDRSTVGEILGAVASGTPPRILHPLDDATRRSIAAGFFFYGKKP